MAVEAVQGRQERLNYVERRRRRYPDILITKYLHGTPLCGSACLQGQRERSDPAAVCRLSRRMTLVN